MSSASPLEDGGKTLRGAVPAPTGEGQFVLAIGRCEQAASSLLTIASPWSLIVAPSRSMPQDRRPAQALDHRPGSSETCEAPSSMGVEADPAESAEPGSWTGGEGRSLTIAGDAFHLTWCFVGPSTDDPHNPSLIDPRLELAPRGRSAAPVLKQFSSYSNFSPEERRAYLEWVSSGRGVPSPPRAFVLLFVTALEHAIVRDRLGISLAQVRAELASLLGRCAEDPASANAVIRLLTLCEFIDPDFIPSPVPATVAANFRSEMPFDVRHFLGWMMRTAGRLEAEGGLLFYLQQPDCRLGPHESQYFNELHAIWCLRYAEASREAFPGVATMPRLELPYEPLVGDFGQTFTSDLPDLAAIAVPTPLKVLFRDCSEALAHLRNEPVGRVLANMPIPAVTEASSNQGNLCWKVGARARLAALVPDATPRPVPVADLLSTLLEDSGIPTRKLLPARLAKEISRRLDQEGFGFEPDWRSGFPRSLRLDRRITVFRTGRTSHQKPSDAFLLAQAAVVASSVAQLKYPSLRPLALEEIEERLPFRHRFSDSDYARLRATAVAIATLDERPRTFIHRWVKRLAHARRIDDLITGFGMAFRGQRRNKDLEKLARAIVVESQSLISVDDMLAAAADTAIPEECFHRTLGLRVEALRPTSIDASPLPDPAGPFSAPANLPDPPLANERPTSFDGLDDRHAELLLALHDRPRTPAELGELARTRRLSLAAAVARINEWALLTFDADAVEEDEEIVLSVAAREFLDQRMRPR